MKVVETLQFGQNNHWQAHEW